MSPKVCPCGKRGRCLDTRQEEAFVYRRYACTCSRRWSTVEILLDERGSKKGHTLLDRLQVQFLLTYLEKLVAQLKGKSYG